MGGRKILITVSEEQYKALEKMAEERGLGRVSVLVNNYRELAGYVEQKRFGSIESFATFAMESVMQRNQLTEAQKARIGKSIN